MANLNPFSVFKTNETISPKQEEENEETTTIEVIPIETKETEEEMDGEEGETVVEESPEVIIEMKFSVIAGSFSSEKNANRLVNQLQSENYNAEIIGTSRNGLIRVCYENFDTKEEATSMLHD